LLVCLFVLIVVIILCLGSSLYLRFQSLGSALQHAYPEFDWDISKFSIKGKKSEQRLLKVKIEELLTGIEIMEEYQHPDLIWGVWEFFYL
jgi:hypothetical protein